MKSLQEYINEAKATVSFQRKHSPEGTVYDQTITISLSEEELSELNDNLNTNTDKKGTVLASDYMHKLYISSDLPLKYGKNYLHLSTLKAIQKMDIEGVEKSKYRNTLLIIKKR